MKINQTSIRLTILIVSIFLLASFQAANASNIQERGHFFHKRSIVGSWDAKIDFFGSASPALYSFQRGGTLTESDNPGFDPNFDGNALSPGIGAWEKTSRRGFVAKYRKLAFDINGQFVQVYTASLKAKIIKDGSLRGTVSIIISLPDGTIVGEIPNLDFTATRITLD